MKQGRAQHSGDAGQKREPIPHAINPGAVSEIGIHHVRTAPEPMTLGRGYTAPKADTTIHHCGSQGKHR